MNAVKANHTTVIPLKQAIENLKDIEASIPYNTASQQEIRIERMARILATALDDLEARITALEARHE